VELNQKIEFDRSKELGETRIRRYNFGTTAKQAAEVWACAAKKDNDLVKKCMEYEVEGARPIG